MLSTRDRVLLGAAASLAVTATLLAGCSAKDDKTSPAASSASAALESPAAGSPGGGPIGVSAGGVTTRMDEPAQSTEEQYAQSCLAAKDWMTEKGGNPQDHVEPLLKDVQGSQEPSPVTFKKTWSELSAAQQSAVIIAVRAAADGGC